MTHSFQLAHAATDTTHDLLIANQKLTAGFEEGILPGCRFRDGVLARFKRIVINANAGEIWRQRLGVPGWRFCLATSPAQRGGSGLHRPAG